MIRVYLAGPIGQSDQFRNVRNAINEAEALRRLGFAPFVPHALFCWDLMHPAGYEDWMAYDFSWLEASDCLYRIPGHSPGADREVAHARDLGIPVFTDANALMRWAATYNASEADSWENLGGEIEEWQHKQFPTGTVASAVKHLGREWAELHGAIESGASDAQVSEELADMVHLLIAAADRRGIDLLTATRAKFTANKLRTWGPPDAAGVVEHVREARG